MGKRNFFDWIDSCQNFQFMTLLLLAKCWILKSETGIEIKPNINIFVIAVCLACNLNTCAISNLERLAKFSN